jgi:hypothetical protein
MAGPGLLCTGGADSCIRGWDIRQQGNAGPPAAFVIDAQQPGEGAPHASYIWSLLPAAQDPHQLLTGASSKEPVGVWLMIVMILMLITMMLSMLMG